MIRIATLAGLAAGAACFGLAHAAEPPTTAKAFVHVAGQSDSFERQAGVIASELAKGSKVKAFGDMMVKEHAKTTQDLTAAAKKDGLDPGAKPPALSADQEKMLAALKGAGANFDKVYIDQQVAAHQMALNAMQTYAAKGDKPNLKTAAASTVPLVQHHLMMAKDLQSSMTK